MSRRHKAKRWAQQDLPREREPWRCPECGKLRFPSKKKARAWARTRFPGRPVRVYECTGMWHFTSQDTETTERIRELLYQRLLADQEPGEVAGPGEQQGEGDAECDHPGEDG
jgi:hypothetical protein